MSALLRKALFWLMMLAIPLQGIAGVAMRPLHAPAYAMGQMQAAGGMDVHASDAMPGMAQHAVKDCADVLPGCDHRHAGGLLKCGLSAACGLVAGPAVQMPAFVRPGPSQAPAPLRSNLRVAFCTGAPDRPPRSLV